MMRKLEIADKKSRDSQIDYWYQGALQDWDTCQAICFDAKRYGASLFFLHLSIEKLLKALFVAKNNQYAPMTHNLLALVEGCQLECDETRELKLATINEFNMVTRYPSQKADFYATATKSFAESHINDGKEIFAWIDQILQKLL